MIIYWLYESITIDWLNLNELNYYRIERFYKSIEWKKLSAAIVAKCFKKTKYDELCLYTNYFVILINLTMMIISCLALMIIHEDESFW